MSGNNDRNNPKNPESELYKKLTKIFSGPIVNQRSQNTRKYRRDKLDKFAKVFKDTQGRKFQRAQNDRIFRDHSAQYLSTFERAQRYADFELMEFDPILASVLDIYADEMTSHNQYQKILHIKSEKNEIRDILSSLFYNVLNIEYNLYSWARQLCKFGDFFTYLDVDERVGIKRAIVLPPAEVERVEGLDKDNPDYIQYKWSTANVVFENFQVAHFKIDGNDKYAPLGTSVLEPARRIWRQLCISIGEKVLTVRGQKNIENILVGDEVYSWSVEKNILEPTKVVAKKWMGKKDVYEIRTNHRALKTTDNHLFLVNDGNGIFYKEAQQIRVGKDSLFLPVNKVGKETHTIKTNPDNYCVKLRNPAEYNVEGIVNKLKEIDTNVGYRIIHQFLRAKKRISYSDFQIINKHFNFDEENVCYFYKHSGKEALVNKNFEFVVDSDFAKMFGFFLGDGWVKKNKVGFALGVYEEENRFYKELLEKYSKSKVTYSPPKPGEKGGQVNVNCKELRDIFEKLDFHTGAYFKDVPGWIFEMSRDIRREFVLGYFDADGGDKDGRLTSISKELLYGIQNLCYSCGIPCNKIIQDRKETFDESGAHRYISYRMYINKNTKSWCETDYSLEKVIGYKFIKSDEDVYDIQVESENHNFVANGVVVHNCLMEDAMMGYRVVRATERKVYYIDVGGIPPEDIEQHMLGIMQSTKKNQIVDPQSGRVDLRYNALSLEDDIYIAVRGTEQGTRIESLPGGDMVGAIDDIKYMKDKLFAAVKIPQSYLIRGEGGEEEKGTLAQKDIRFARTIQRLQRSIVAELDKIAKIHLYTLGYRNADLISFEILLNNPSKLAEQQELEHWKTKFDVAAGAVEACVSERWIAKNILNLSDEEFLRNRQEILHDVAFAQLKSLAEKGGIDGAASTGGGGSSLSDFGPSPDESGEETPTGADGNDGGGFDLPFSPGDTAAGSIPGEGGEESDSMLLATPGNDSQLKEQGHLTPGSKGHVYHPVKDDQRDDGARTRSFRQAASSRQSRMTKGQVNLRLHEIINKAKTKAIYEEDSFVSGLNEETKAILENLKKTGVNKK